MSEQVEFTPEARWRHLCGNGRKVKANVQSNDLIEDKPKWLDEERWARARKACHKFFLGIQYSSYTGLLLILQLPDGLEPLLSTGNSKDIPSLYKRYLSTILHVKSWYEDDIFNPETKGYKSIRQVRGMHKRVQIIMNDKFKVRDMDGHERVWMNQYDVAMTQFAFIGLAMLFPQKSAMIAATKQDLEDINYYWRVLGHMMGNDLEYNLCQFDNYDDTHALMKLIFDREYKDNLTTLSCQKGLEMTQSIVLALHYFAPLVTFNSLAHWWKDCFTFNGYELQPLTNREKVLDLWTSVSFNHLLKYEGFLNFSTKLHMKRFEQRLKNKDKVYEKLKEQYKDQQDHTYYSDRVDYFGNKTDVTTSQDDNNNVEQDESITKLEGGCPFGYTAKLPEVAEATS